MFFITQDASGLLLPAEAGLCACEQWTPSTAQCSATTPQSLAAIQSTLTDVALRPIFFGLTLLRERTKNYHCAMVSAILVLNTMFVYKIIPPSKEIQIKDATNYACIAFSTSVNKKIIFVEHNTSVIELTFSPGFRLSFNHPLFPDFNYLLVPCSQLTEEQEGALFGDFVTDLQWIYQCFDCETSQAYIQCPPST